MKNSIIALVAGLALVLPLYGCGGGESSGSNPAAPHSELLFVTEGATIKTEGVTASGGAELASVTIPGVPGTYSRTGTEITVTIPNHDLIGEWWVDLHFEAGTGGTATSGRYQVASVIDSDTFTVTDTASGDITGGTMYRKFATELAATYEQVGTTITVTLPNHGLSRYSTLNLHFTSGEAIDFVSYPGTIVDADTFTVVSDNNLTTSGNVTVTTGDYYAIFGLAMHPNGKWLYAASAYPSGEGYGPFAWGNSLISRFSIDWTSGGLTFEESFQNVGEMPANLQFSADGEFLYVQDDQLDRLEMWQVDSTSGAISHVADSGNATTYLHGIGISADGTRVYNGDTVFTVDTSVPSITQTSSNIGGCNTSAIVGSTLFCADNDAGWALRTYSLTFPDSPEPITSLSTDNQQARELVVAENGFRLVASGWCGLRSYDYDGTTITPAAAAGSNEYVDCGGSWLTNGVDRAMYRNLSLNQAGDMIAAPYYTMDNSTWMWSQPSGYKLLSLAQDGSLALVQDIPAGSPALQAKFFQKP